MSSTPFLDAWIKQASTADKLKAIGLGTLGLTGLGAGLGGALGAGTGVAAEFDARGGPRLLPRFLRREPDYMGAAATAGAMGALGGAGLGLSTGLGRGAATLLFDAAHPFVQGQLGRATKALF